MIRTDDAGMSHSVNMALEKLIASGLPVSVSVMFPTPWYQETVDILKRHPEVSVGIHLTLNSEWKNYRWGPVLGRTAVPSLVDADGYFFASADALHQNHPDLLELEKELRAADECRFVHVCRDVPAVRAGRPTFPRHLTTSRSSDAMRPTGRTSSCTPTSAASAASTR